MFTFDPESHRYLWPKPSDQDRLRLLSVTKGKVKWERDPLSGDYYTHDPRAARPLRDSADARAEKELYRTFLVKTPWLDALPHPPHLALLTFQPFAARYALERNRSYLALEMGLGKTIVSAVVINALRGIALYVCPPYMVENVAEELRKWAVGPLRISTSITMYPRQFPAVWIIPDSRIHMSAVRGEVAAWLRAYANLGVPTTLFVDEAQRYCNMEARRTRALFQGLVPAFRKVVFLSGTPMPSRPLQLWPVLSECAPETLDFMPEEVYGQRYCGGRYVEGKGWDFKHASNVEELAARIKGPFMLRMWKRDVLPHLPPKIEDVVVIGDDLPPEIVAMEAQILKRYSPEDLIGRSLAELAHLDEDEELPISTYRRLLAMIKAKAALAYIRGTLEDSESNFIVYGYHVEALEFLQNGLADYDPLVVTGKTPSKRRHQLVKTFQTEKRRRLMLGNYLALGVGHNLTKADNVILVEYSWVPADNDQALDRAHRQGQLNTVYGRYLVFRNSLDRRVIEVILRKKRVTRHV